MNKIFIKINYLLVLLLIFSFGIASFGSSFRPRTVAEERERVYASKANPTIIYQPRIQKKRDEDMYSEEAVSPDGIDYTKYNQDTTNNFDNGNAPLDVFETWLNNSLNVSFGSNNFSYTKNSDEKKFIIKTWYNGLTEKLLTYFAVANSQNPLSNIKEVTSAFGITVYDYLLLLGINDWNIELYVVNDVTQREIFLSYQNRKLVYDITNN